MDHPPIAIKGVEYSYIKTRNQMPVSVYRGENTFLRIGPADLIKKEIAFHKSLQKFEFPVAVIIEEGEHEDSYYYIESSLGDEHYGNMFKNDVRRLGRISPELFQTFIELVEKYAEAELQTLKVDGWNIPGFKEMIHADLIFQELPHLKDKSIEAMRKVEKSIAALPGVLSHGDFNPHNIFEKGVTDWERGCYAPLGYDLVTCFTQFMMFPVKGDYEYTRTYFFSRNEWDKYFQKMESIFSEHDVPELFRTTNDFIFCRSIWSVVRMHKWPKLQAWRYDQYEKLLEVYLKGGDVVSFLFEYSVRD